MKEKCLRDSLRYDDDERSDSFNRQHASEKVRPGNSDNCPRVHCQIEVRGGYEGDGCFGRVDPSGAGAWHQPLDCGPRGNAAKTFVRAWSLRFATFSKTVSSMPFSLEESCTLHWTIHDTWLARMSTYVSPPPT